MTPIAFRTLTTAICGTALLLIRPTVSFSIQHSSHNRRVNGYLAASLDGDDKANGAAALPPLTATSINPRHVCLFDDYDTVHGPYFHALFDQLFEQASGDNENRCQRILICSTQFDSEAGKPATAASLAKLAKENKYEKPSEREQTIAEDLDAECRTVFMECYYPESMRQLVEDFKPNVLWVGDPKSNIGIIRYLMRTSGMEEIIKEKCGGLAEDGPACVYVGEGPGGVACSGASLPPSYQNLSPEPQRSGLKLLGPKRSLEIHSKSEKDQTKCESAISLRADQVFLWSQSSDTVTSVIMNPLQRGSLERMEFPPPVSPLVEESADIGGVKCTGEPAVDPSRQLQSSSDSDWED